MPIENDKNRAFLRAASDGDISQLKILLSEGVPVDSLNDFHETALVHAVGFADLEVVKFLIQNGADVHAKDYFGRSLLFNGIQSYKISELLLQNGCDPNEVTDEESPLMAALTRWRVDLVKLLLEFGADPNYTDSHGDDVLAIAEYGSKVRIKQIKEAGKGENQFLEIIDLLRQKGAIETNIVTFREKHTPWGQGILRVLCTGDFEFPV
jgi:ankyrin repeat protein